MICDLPDAAPEECDCHEWFDLDEIGQWPHSLAGGRASQPKSVREIVATKPIWDRSELPREELTAHHRRRAPHLTRLRAQCNDVF